MRVILAVVAVACGLYAGPPLLENASGQCEAVARRLDALDSGRRAADPFKSMLIIGIGTPVIAKLAQQKFPAIPVSVSCAGGYWWLILNANQARREIAGA